MNFRRPIPRSGKPIKRSPIKKRKRSKSEFARIYGSKERVLFVKGLGCVVWTVWCLEGWENGEPVENAHIQTGGTGRKADYTKIVPLCESHHRMLHRWGRTTFEKHYHIDLEKCAEETEKRWLEDTETT